MTAGAGVDGPASGPDDYPDERSVGDLSQRPRGAAPFSTIAPYLAAVLSTLWLLRPTILDRRLFGNIGDARWSVAVHEHWYQVWRGHEALRDLSFFSPQHDMLGTTEPFFVQGQVHALLRAFGFGLVDSWTIAQAATILVGALGVAALSRRVLERPWAQVGLVLVACLSYPFITQSGHVQLFGMLAFSWILVGVHAVHADRSATRGVALLALVPPLLAMSSWYAFALGTIVSATLGVFLLVVHDRATVVRTVRDGVRRVLAALRRPAAIVAVALGAVGWAFAAWIYLPGRSIVPDPQWSEVPILSARWSDLVNASLGGGGLWSGFYERAFVPGTWTGEQAQGFTPVLLVLFVVVGLAHLRGALLHGPDMWPARGRAGRNGIVAAWCTVVVIVLFFLVDERGLGLYRLVWFHVPAVESIRAPFRVQALCYPLAGFVLLRTAELLDVRWRSRTHPKTGGFPVVTVASVAVVALLVVEMHRPVDSHWTSDDLLSPELRAHVEEIEAGCDAVVVIDENPADPVWVTLVDAVILSTLTGVPTPQGYGRADPIGHPGPTADGVSLLAWMRELDFDGRACSVSSAGVEPIT